MLIDQAQVGHLLRELGGVDQVAVVRQRDGGGRATVDVRGVRPASGAPLRARTARREACAQGRLRVLPVGRAGGGVPGVADRDMAPQARQGRLVEDLGDQAEVLVDDDPVAVADRDAGGLLAAVLQRVQAEVGQLGDLLAGRPDPEHAALVLRTRLLGVEVVAQLAVASGHLPLLAESGRWAGRSGWSVSVAGRSRSAGQTIAHRSTMHRLTMRRATMHRDLLLLQTEGTSTARIPMPGQSTRRC